MWMKLKVFSQMYLVQKFSSTEPVLLLPSLICFWLQYRNGKCQGGNITRNTNLWHLKSLIIIWDMICVNEHISGRMTMIPKPELR